MQLRAAAPSHSPVPLLPTVLCCHTRPTLHRHFTLGEHGWLLNNFHQVPWTPNIPSSSWPPNPARSQKPSQNFTLKGLSSAVSYGIKYCRRQDSAVDNKNLSWLLLVKRGLNEGRMERIKSTVTAGRAGFQPSLSNDSHNGTAELSCCGRLEMATDPL